MRKIVVIGAGYVGLVTGACLSHKNNSVTIVEKNNTKITDLLSGKIPFYESGLEGLVKKAIENKSLTFTTKIAQALSEEPEFIFSCVGTPSSANGEADLSAVFEVAKEVGKHLKSYSIFINKSTVPVGTTKKTEHLINLELVTRKISIPFDTASNPEFLQEGCAIENFMYPDRIVIGTNSEKAKLALQELYKPFLKTTDQFVCMDIESAELTKYASNAMLALRISFINQLALLADKLGANIDNVRRGMVLDKRIGKHFLNAGIGYGGSCFPKDVRALVSMGEKANLPMSLIKEIDHVNSKQRKLFVQRIITRYHNNLSNKTVGIWGLSFKPETDDIRSAPSIEIIKSLLAEKAKIIVYDPMATENTRKIFGNKVTFASSAQEVLKTTDFLIIATEWHEFLTSPPEAFLDLKDKLVFDGRNCFDPKKMHYAGIEYYSIGRKNEYLLSHPLRRQRHTLVASK